MIGQYPFAAIVGKVIDRYGPWACSLISSLLFSLGFSLFSLEISKTPDDISQPSLSSFRHLAFFFFMVGLGTVFSYFSSLFAASKNFPSYLGIASGASMALFGLSPLFLSLIASNFFTNPDTGLDVTNFLRFMAMFAGAIHLVGAFTLRTPQFAPEHQIPQHVDSEQRQEADERTSLLPGNQNHDALVNSVKEDGTVLELFQDTSFWILVLVTLITLGSCEMVISNIGTIILSLPSSSSTSTMRAIPNTDVSNSTQVRLISIANTLSRLLVGPLADFISPVASYLPSGARCFPRKHHVSRVAFLSVATFSLAATFFWMEIGIRSQEAVWILSLGTGSVYGATFTVLPSIVSSIWGLKNLGRNFGILTYAPFIGTPLFSYTYAFVSARHAPDVGVCEGVPCWRLTFWLSSGSAMIACIGSLVLWRTWKGRV